MLALLNIVNDISTRQACLIMYKIGVKNLEYLEVEIEGSWVTVESGLHIKVLLQKSHLEKYIQKLKGFALG